MISIWLQKPQLDCKIQGQVCLMKICSRWELELWQNNKFTVVSNYNWMRMNNVFMDKCTNTQAPYEYIWFPTQ